MAAHARTRSVLRVRRRAAVPRVIECCVATLTRTRMAQENADSARMRRVLSAARVTRTARRQRKAARTAMREQRRARLIRQMRFAADADAMYGR